MEKLLTHFITVFAIIFFLVPPQLLAQGEKKVICNPSDNITRVDGRKECLSVKTFGVQTAGESPVLIVFIHGDVSRGGPADYMYKYAEKYAKPGFVSVAILRPEYFDSEGNKSTGEHYGRTDSYTKENIEEVAVALAKLKNYHKAKKLLLVGHSGGAAYAGVILGRHSGLVDGALLVSCPCDINSWRTEKGWNYWGRSLSPSSFVDKVPANTSVVAMTGDLDETVSPNIAKTYIESLTRRGVKAKFRIVVGAQHGFSSLGNSSEFSSALEFLIKGSE